MVKVNSRGVGGGYELFTTNYQGSNRSKFGPGYYSLYDPSGKVVASRDIGGSGKALDNWINSFVGNNTGNNTGGGNNSGGSLTDEYKDLFKLGQQATRQEAQLAKDSALDLMKAGNKMQSERDKVDFQRAKQYAEFGHNLDLQRRNIAQQSAQNLYYSGRNNGGGTLTSGFYT